MDRKLILYGATACYYGIWRVTLVPAMKIPLYPIAELGVYRGTYFAPPSIASALVNHLIRTLTYHMESLEIYSN